VHDVGKIQGVWSGIAALKLGEQCQKPGEIRGRNLPFACEGPFGAGSDGVYEALQCASYLLFLATSCKWFLLCSSVLMEVGSEVK